MSIEIGEQAPDLRLPTDGGAELSLADMKGKKVVLYFYPKDSTPGCTIEAGDFRDAIEAFAKANTEIVGVSKDSVKSHDNFKAKQSLPFTLISDSEGTLCDAFGVWIEKKNYGRTYMGIERATFLIDEKGILRNEWHKVKVKGHAAKVLEAAQAL